MKTPTIHECTMLASLALAPACVPEEVDVDIECNALQKDMHILWGLNGFSYDDAAEALEPTHAVISTSPEWLKELLGWTGEAGFKAIPNLESSRYDWFTAPDGSFDVDGYISLVYSFEETASKLTDAERAQIEYWLITDDALNYAAGANGYKGPSTEDLVDMCAAVNDVFYREENEPIDCIIRDDAADMLANGRMGPYPDEEYSFIGYSQYQTAKGSAYDYLNNEIAAADEIGLPILTGLNGADFMELSGSGYTSCEDYGSYEGTINGRCMATPEDIVIMADIFDERCGDNCSRGFWGTNAFNNPNAELFLDASTGYPDAILEFGNRN